MQPPIVNRPTFRETFVIKPTISPPLWEVIGSIGNRVRMDSQDECIRWAKELGLNYDLEVTE